MSNETPTAFPWSHGDVTCTGMTLRDYFAAKAMAAIVAIPDQWHQNTHEAIAEGAYAVADAMLKARQL